MIGLAVAGGGAYLAMLGGSVYCFVGGIAVALAGWWNWRGEARGSWAYSLFLAATIIWALWESGIEAW
jgi:glucose dehydrogenase